MWCRCLQRAFALYLPPLSSAAKCGAVPPPSPSAAANSIHGEGGFYLTICEFTTLHPHPPPPPPTRTPSLYKFIVHFFLFLLSPFKPIYELPYYPPHLLSCVVRLVVTVNPCKVRLNPCSKQVENS